MIYEKFMHTWNTQDIVPKMLAFYAFSKNEARDSKKQKELLQRAKDLGITKVSLERVIRD